VVSSGQNRALAPDQSPQARHPVTYRTVAGVFFVLVVLSFAAPLVPEQLLRYGGSDTDKAFYFRSVIELALPLYLYLVVSIPPLRPHLKQPLTLALGGFLLINVVATLTGVNPGLSFWGNLEHMGGVYQLVHLILLYLYILLLLQLGGKWRERLLQLSLLVPSLVAINGIFGKLGWPTLVHDPSLPGRIASTLYNPDYLGSYLVVPLFVAVLLGIRARDRTRKTGYGAVAVLLAAALYLSGTRGAMLGALAGAAVGLVVYLALTKNHTVRKVGFTLIGVGVLGTAALFAAGSHLPADSFLHHLVVWNDADAKSRLLNWGIALSGYPAHPVFGVGPENYYYISNQFYNPAIHAYDSTYLARPHNYLIELLVTTGPLGVLAFLSVLGCAVWSAGRAFATNRLGIAGLAVLAGGFAAYLIQSLTLFDTVSGAITFFTLLGVAGQMWQPEERATSRASFSSPQLSWLVSVAAAAGAILTICVTNILPFAATVATAKAEAAAPVDPWQAADYYQQAVTTPANFDQSDLALSLSDFASGLAESATTDSQRQLAQQELNRSITLSNQITAQDPTNARNWLDLANDYIAQFLAFGGSLDSAQAALNRASALEPQRPDAQLLQADVYIIENRLPDAEKLLEHIAATFPNIERAPQRLAAVLQHQGQIAAAVQWFEQAVRLGYAPPTFASVSWVGEYYAGLGEYSKEVALYEKTLATTDPNDLDLAVALVNAYMKDGRRDAALALYRKVVALDPARAQEMPGVTGN
jgi:tetratricopeptide (TPR) repeat protein/O-antigen ligase